MHRLAFVEQPALRAAQGPSSVNLPITDLTTNQTVGNVTTVFRSALTICVTDMLAPGTLFALCDYW